MGLRDEVHRRPRNTRVGTHKKYYKDVKKILLPALSAEKAMSFQHCMVSNAHKPRDFWKNIQNNVADFKTNIATSPHICKTLIELTNIPLIYSPVTLPIHITCRSK